MACIVPSLWLSLQSLERCARFSHRIHRLESPVLPSYKSPSPFCSVNHLVLSLENECKVETPNMLDSVITFNNSLCDLTFCRVCSLDLSTALKIRNRGSMESRCVAIVLAKITTHLEQRSNLSAVMQFEWLVQSTLSINPTSPEDLTMIVWHDFCQALQHLLSG